jgi:DNA polymerase III subunit epsilon
MTVRRKFVLWVAGLFLGVVAIVAVVGFLMAAGLPEEERAVLRQILDKRGALLAYLALILVFVCGAVVKWLFSAYLGAARRLAEQTRTLLAVDTERRVATDGAIELAELAQVINMLGDANRGARRDLEARVAEAGVRLEEERNRLAALMSELSEGVLLCNAEGRILLYNEQARALFEAGVGRRDAEIAARRQSLVGLGRSVFALLDRDQIVHALDKLQYAVERGLQPPFTRFLAAAAGGALLKVRVAPFLATEGRLGGMVLALEDVTDMFSHEAERRALLQALATQVRQPAASIRAAAENLVTFPDMGDADRARFEALIAAESRGLSATIDAALREYANALKAGIALEDMPLDDFLGVAYRHIENAQCLVAEIENAGEDAWIKVDSFALVQAFAACAARLYGEFGISRFGLRGGMGKDFAEIDIIWRGAHVPSDVLPRWEAEPLGGNAQQAALTLRDVLDRHGGEVWHQADGDSERFRFLLPLGERATPKQRRPVSVESRPEYYDFDLFRNMDAAEALAERRLADLSFTVFDTETTGLEPSAGDEIISIGAVRIVNGRLLKHEVYEQLVNPRRPVSADSARVHGIKGRDLADQPPIGAVLPGFHRYCEDTVLVAHNAAFDMRFLELKEMATGIRFAQPVLDTLLLSAVVHPNHQDHRLEAIAERLGVNVTGRHTALGDALVTGEIFLRLIPLLAQQGIVTLAQALDASRETYYVRLKY